MAEVTEADREKAWLVLSALPISIPGYSPETVRKANEHLAAALAEEREKARAPFLALADRLDIEAETAEVWDGNEQRAYQDIANRIRAAAGEG